MTPFVRDNLRSTLQGKKVLLGITGSIAAFKACDIVRFLSECGAFVQVVLTQGAENFVTRTTLATLSGAPVHSDFWNSDSSPTLHGTHHIDTARWADLILVAPATAHSIGKFANGLADDLLSTEILAARSPLLIAPAMNPTMFAHPAVQENLEKLRSRGVGILGPSHGLTSCNEEGLGRMVEPETIVEAVASAFYATPHGKSALITLGPTRSSIDPVRFISNRSSGLMGTSLCWAALQSGYQVTAVCGTANVTLPHGIKSILVHTAQNMGDAVFQAWPSNDIFLSAGAVLDWDVKNPSHSKLKKTKAPPKIQLEKNLDILATVSKSKKKGQFVLGFAAESHEPVINAQRKLKLKKCDAIFANDISSSHHGFESPLNGGWWITPENVLSLETALKPDLARKLISLIEKAY